MKVMTYENWMYFYFDGNEDEVVANWDSEDTREMYQEYKEGL